MVKTIVIISVCIFIGVGVFSFSKAISLFKMNESLLDEINKNYKPKIDSLEKENTKINTDLASAQNSLAVLENENGAIKRMIRAKDNTLKQLQIALKRKEKTLDEAREKGTELESENNLLKDKISAMFLEFSEMKKTFFSVKALQEQIKTLKYGKGLKKNRKIKKEEKKDKKSNKYKGMVKNNQRVQKHIVPHTEINTRGNRGFLIREGRSTYVPKLKIVVTPVEG